MSSDLAIAASTINRQVVESPQLMGKECVGCRRILEYDFFQRDASYRDGRKDLCDLCAGTKRLSIAEHTQRLHEQNYGSEAVRAQRWKEQRDWYFEASRTGRYLHHSDLIRDLKRLAPDLFFVDGNFVGDVSIFRTYPQPLPRLSGRDFEYLFYMPLGYSQEYSTLEFSDLDVPIREKKRGWRTVLLRLVCSRVLTEGQVNEVFGEAHGPASRQYRKQLYAWRNGRAWSE